MIKSDRFQSAGRNVAAATPITRFRAEIDALTDDEILVVNTDVALAASAALAAAPKIMEYRAEILAMPGMDPKLIDRLVPLAGATDYAQSVWVTEESAGIGDALLRGITTRDRFSKDVGPLVSRGLLPTESLNCFSGGTSYRSVGGDLAAISVYLIARWGTIEGRTSITRAELDDAASLAAVLKNEALNRERPSPATSRATRDRAAMFTLLVRCYEELRRAVGWIRWYEGDANRIAPTLYVLAATARRRGRKTAAPVTVNPADEPANDNTRDSGVPGTTEAPPAAATG